MSLGRVRSRAAFAALAERGARARHGSVRVTYLPPSSGDPVAAVAYAVGKPVGSAVDRNRVRRRLRAAVTELDLPAGTYLLGATSAALSAPYQRLRADLAAAVEAATTAARPVTADAGRAR